MPASPHSASDSVLPRRGALVELDVPALAVGLQRVAEEGDRFRVVETGDLEIVVRRPWETDGATYKLRPGHVRSAE
jgi:hypothetical protein